VGLFWWFVKVHCKNNNHNGRIYVAEQDAQIKLLRNVKIVVMQVGINNKK
jgi:hypothetical protein